MEKINMMKWVDDALAAEKKQGFLVLSFPAIQKMGISVKELVQSSDLQAQAMKIVADLTPEAAASVSMMDLSLEAEAFGSQVVFSDDEVPTIIGSIVEEEEEADALEIPEIGAGRTQIYIDAIEKAAKLITDRPVFAGVIGPFSLAGRLMDVTDTVTEEIVEGMMQERGHDHEHEEAGGHDHEYEEAGEHDHEHEETGEHEHEESDHAYGGDSSHEEHEEADEHVWTSPVKAAEITVAIAEKMAEIDPANAEAYLANAGDYEKQILDVDEQFREIVKNAQRRTIVFGDRFPVRYFAEEYGLEYYAAFPGCSSESEPSASTLAFLIDKVREEKIPVVFSIELSNGNIARAICESTDAVQRTFYSCHNVTQQQMEGGATYVSMMSENLEVIREALGGGEPR